MNLPKDYLDDLLVRMTHNSCAVENNSVTLNETISILLYRTIPGKLSVREFYEIENHSIAIKYIIDNINQDFTIPWIHNVHSLLMDRLHHEKGRFKSHENAIVGATFPTASLKETPILMDQWLLSLNNQIQQAKSPDDIIHSVCSSHIEFERIHPYVDGNGRMGRLLMVHLLLKNRILPLVIHKEHKQEYLQFLKNQDVEGFAVYARKNINNERQRYNAFLDSLSKE
ncbi:Fic family protein [Paenibacillus polymyxa]|uniref:Fic family protein n=1 Tax=Paenibacillus polymyxa TaxID=1406 RepID=UPI0023797DE2|nr:Fic family protein [Paenibacillus polymyxa]WDM21290.1 Fic family protein [Paenibacillus polymyxa]